MWCSLFKGLFDTVRRYRMIIVLVGESASGKSTIENLIRNRNKSFSKIVSYTTRPMRDKETEGIDYHFISDEEFESMIKNDDFVEFAKYRGWNYGSAKKDYNDNKNHIAVLTPHGCRTLKRWGDNNNTKIISIYFKVDRRSRMIKILNRGDDIDEAYRRNISDVGQFDGFEDEADYIINNDNYKKGIEEIYSETMNIVKGEMNE